MRTKAAELIDKVNEFTELSISIDSISLRNNAADFQVFIGCRVSALRLLLPGEACEGGKTGRRRKKSQFFKFFFLQGSHYSDFTDPTFEENNDFKAPEYWGGGWWLSSPGLWQLLVVFIHR